MGFSPPVFSCVLVEVVHVLLVDGADRYHHDLNVRAGGEVAHLAELAGVVEEILKGRVGVEGPEVLFGDLERLVNAFLDRNGRNHDDELGEAIAAVQLEDGAQIHVGLARAGFHLHRKIARGQRGRRPQAVANLDVAEIGQEFVIQQLQAVADAQVTLRKSQSLLRSRRIAGDSKLGAADFLPTKQVAHRLDGGVLVVQVGLKVKFHRCPS